jgi:hypothetical protein
MNHLVVTTINAPTQAMLNLAKGAAERDWSFVIIGDRKSPPDFSLQGTDYYDLERQSEAGFEFARLAPVGHYARKNVGYLVAISRNASAIIETDDDNLPLRNFWDDRAQTQTAPAAVTEGWVNVYRHFTDAPIWPRGLPLREIQQPLTPRTALNDLTIDCPVQQGLANENPDVDAIFRLAFPLPFDFEARGSIITAKGAWCPFNSQNTKWFPVAYPLLYLPFHCSFRMTDIWRSFVVQRVLYANDLGLLFHDASVYQDRNEHDLMKDFSDEVVGYLHNEQIRERLLELPLQGRKETMLDDMESCYDLLIKMELVGTEERALIKAWRNDLDMIAKRA